MTTARGPVKPAGIDVHRVARGATVIALALAALMACDPGRVTFGDEQGEPPPPDTTGTGGGTVQRAELAVQLMVGAADMALANLVGLELGGLPVRIQRKASSDSALSAVTNSAGAVRFDELPPGLYEISVTRPLSESELALLDPADRSTSLFAGGANVNVRAPSATATVELVAARRGSVVFSEVHFLVAPVDGAGDLGHYMEVYNNADTAVYLDGLWVFRSSGMHIGTVDGCYEPELTLDSTGLWITSLYAFPGNGSDYRLAPGDAAVIALDAVNHSANHPDLQDLREARFEFIGNSADPNNPFAADMISLRTTDLSHGDSFRAAVYGIARPLAGGLAALPVAIVARSVNQFTAHKIPRDSILDAAALQSTLEQAMAALSWSFGIRDCDPFVSPEIDRAPARLIDYFEPRVVRRRTLSRTSDGREILQRTRTSARDFELGPPLRRSLRRPN